MASHAAKRRGALVSFGLLLALRSPPGFLWSRAGMEGGNRWPRGTLIAVAPASPASRPREERACFPRAFALSLAVTYSLDPATNHMNNQS
jgi:hypothetical protein